MKKAQYQWRIQDFPDGEGGNHCVLVENLLFEKIFAEHCMNMKEIGSGEGGGAAGVPGIHPLDPPMSTSSIQRISL